VVRLPAHRGGNRPGPRPAAQGTRGLRANEDSVPSYYLIPILLVIMSVGLMALIYWGSFVEERRNKSRA
jgi:hypothetical protein